ncbi:MAG: hypothetical protein PVI59_11235 [Anaerolineae bacterium]|jgi:hypothetical protein
MVNERESRQDEELAAFTDALLGKDVEADIEARPPLADTVELLARVLAPEEPPDRLRQRVHRAIAEEWDFASHRSWFFQMFRVRRRPLWIAAVAALAVLAAVTILLVTPGTEGVEGAAEGGPWLIPLIIVMWLVAAGLVGWILRRR